MRANNSHALAIAERRATVPPASASLSPMPRVPTAIVGQAVSDGGVAPSGTPAESHTGSARKFVAVSRAGFARAWGRALQRCWPDQLAAANDIGAPLATLKNWWLGRNAPDGFYYNRAITINPALSMTLHFEMEAELRSENSYDRNVDRVLANAAEEAVDGGFCGQE